VSKQAPWKEEPGYLFPFWRKEIPALDPTMIKDIRPKRLDRHSGLGRGERHEYLYFQAKIINILP